MDKFSDETMCRICFRKQDTVFSLFRKRKGISPCEKLNKIGLKTDLNDTGPSCICCDCLTELETTINFLKKCEKSNQILAQHLGDVLKDNALHVESRVLDGIEEECEAKDKQELRADEVCVIEEARCEECGSRRRCRHWSPPSTYTCPQCQKVFNRKFNFKLHMKRHNKEREWWCATCGASAVSRWLAAQHCRPRARRACPEPGCDRTYTSTTNLHVHLRAHNGERPFECNDCGKKFSSKNTLQNHVRIHTGALPYICPICGKQFRTNKLSAHMSTHTDTRHACPRPGCSKRYTSRPALNRHVRLHLGPGGLGPGGQGPGGQAPGGPAHACALCSCRYHHKQSLNKHMRKQHAQNPAPASEVVTNGLTHEMERDLSC